MSSPDDDRLRSQRDILDFVDRAFFVEYGFVTSDNLIKKREIKRELAELLSKPAISPVIACKRFSELLTDAGISKLTLQRVFQDNLLI